MESHEQTFVFLQNQGRFHQKIVIFQNFGEILAKNIQFRNKNIYDNVYLDAIRNIFPQKFPRKSIFTDKYAKNQDFCLHFGNIATKK